jgi:hypothetical protein
MHGIRVQEHAVRGGACVARQPLDEGVLADLLPPEHQVPPVLRVARLGVSDGRAEEQHGPQAVHGRGDKPLQHLHAKGA